jgi:membrane protein required for colicin V production
VILDVIFIVLLLLAFYRGYQKGLIYSVLSFIAIFLGILLAMNFSSLTAYWMSSLFNIPGSIMPVFSFVVVLIVVILSIKLVAIIMEKMLKAVSLNIFNRLAGAILWGAIASIMFGVTIWLIDQAGIFTANLKAESFTFRYVVPLGPSAIDFVGSLIPFFKEAFYELNKTIKTTAS